MPIVTCVVRLALIFAVACLANGAVPFPDSQAREPARLQGLALKETFTGTEVHFATPLGTVVPVNFKEDGTLFGRAGAVTFFLGAETDRGRWWVAGNKLCQKWKVWFDARTRCVTVRRSGKQLSWNNNDGDTGTGTIHSQRIVQRPQETYTPPVALGGPVPSVKRETKATPPPTAAPTPTSDPEPVTAPKPAQRFVLAGAVRPAPPPPPQSRSLDQRERSNKSGFARSSSKPSRSNGARQPTHRVSGVTPDDVLNLRLFPSNAAPVVGTIPHDASNIRQVSACNNGWCPVAHFGREGWVAQAYLEPVASDSARLQPIPVAAAAAPLTRSSPNGTANPVSFRVVEVESHDVLNIRSGPSTEFGVVGELSPSARGVRLSGECSDIWCPIDYRGRVGWVSRLYLAPEW